MPPEMYMRLSYEVAPTAVRIDGALFLDSHLSGAARVREGANTHSSSTAIDRDMPIMPLCV